MIQLLFATLAWSAEIDLKKVPLEYCEPPLSVAERTADCDENKNFTDAARDCVMKLETMEKNLGEKAQKIARSGLESQQGKVVTAGTEYSFSEEALNYIIGVAKLAKSEIAEYREYLPIPPDFFEEKNPLIEDPIALARTKECFAVTEKGVLERESYLAKKISLYERRKAEAAGHQKSLTQVDLSSVEKGASSPNKTAKSVQGMDVRKSTITKNPKDNKRSAPNH